MVDFFVKLLSTFFYTGLVPFAPGTVGSFAGLLLLLALSDNPIGFWVVFVLITVIGFVVCGRAEKVFGTKDPKQVVIDEVSGIFLAFFMVPLNFVNIVVGFVLYRLLDIVKLFPARRLERLDGSLGIMSDDLLCGVYSCLILQLLLKFNILH